jgi:hypothetical protein
MPPHAMNHGSAETECAHDHIERVRPSGNSRQMIAAARRKIVTSDLLISPGHQEVCTCIRRLSNGLAHAGGAGEPKLAGLDQADQRRQHRRHRRPPRPAEGLTIEVDGERRKRADRPASRMIAHADEPPDVVRWKERIAGSTKHDQSLHKTTRETRMPVADAEVGKAIEITRQNQ